MEKQSSRAAPDTLQTGGAKEDKKKIFICYAGEERSLLKDFIKRFQHHYDEIELLFDGNSHTGNLHTHFKEFAKECDIAILLFNAKFTNLESYANKHEIPILLKRQEEYAVTIVGVVFSDAEIKEWNKKGDIYFFQLRNDELPRTRRPDENADEFNNEFAVYEIIEKQDRSTYHKKLAAWIKESVVKTALKRAEYVKSNPQPDKPNAEEVTVNNFPPSSINQDGPRSAEQTSTILNRINDPFLRALEQQLSMSNDYWFGFEPTEEQKKGPLLPIFFERQRKRLADARKCIDELDEKEDDLFGHDLREALPEMEKVQKDMVSLLSTVNNHEGTVSRLLERFEDQIANIRSLLYRIHKEEIKDAIRNEHLPELFDSLDRLQDKLNEIDTEMYKYLKN